MAEKNHRKEKQQKVSQGHKLTNKPYENSLTEVFKTVAENTHAYLAYLDKDFNFVWVNPAYANGSGYNATYLIGRNHFDLFPNEENEAIFEKVRETGQMVEYHDKPFRYEYQPERGVTYWDWILVPVKDADDKVTGLVLSLVETTERKYTELQLEQIAREWRTTFDSVPDFISIHDTDYKIQRVNRALANALGRSPAELIGKHCYELFHKTSEPAPSCPHRRTLQTREISMEELFEPGLGLYLEVLTAPIFDEGGQVVASVHISRDITARERAEESLRDSERRYRELADMLPQIVFEMDVNGRCTFANRSATEITGYTQDDFKKGVGALDMLVPEYREQAALEIQRVLNSQQSEKFEFIMMRKDGSTYPASGFTSPVIRDGKTVGLVGIIIDLTEQKNIEQLKDDFIGLVSHELRTPLTTIMGSVNMVRNADSRLSREDMHQLLDDAAMASEDLAGILGNLLELSRSKADRLVLHMESVDIRAVAQEVIKQLKPRMSAHRFVVDIPRRRPLVPADPLRLERILHNMLENAIKYSPNGGEIRISARKEDNEMVISISDQGVGISQSDQDRLFTPFQRLEEIKIAGIGLGLMVCRRLVEAHNGRIWVESEPGQGSTFFFTIPLPQKPQ